ncbi:MAG: hypothetical protein AOA66_0961 [Candidatus Bathyarchaeota archaeon BA2]|nr:MAG: hypothetical protein AOA66_0961 [Candidatus Bathyarchaeota archaeon BA2]
MVGQAGLEPGDLSLVRVGQRLCELFSIDFVSAYC